MEDTLAKELGEFMQETDFSLSIIAENCGVGEITLHKVLNGSNAYTAKTKIKIREFIRKYHDADKALKEKKVQKFIEENFKLLYFTENNNIEE